MATKEQKQKAMQKLYDKNGNHYVKTTDFLKEATKESDPFHEDLEWDNDIAGHEHRLTQSRHIIRKFTVIKDGEEGVLMHVPIKVEDAGGDREGHYQIPTVMAQDEQERALCELAHSLVAADRNYGILVAAMKTVPVSIKRAGKHIRSARKQIQAALGR